MHWVPPQWHLQCQTRVFSHFKGTHVHVFFYNICRRNMFCHILFEGTDFVLSYSTHMECIHRWNFFKNKKTRKMKHAFNKDKARLIILKR